MEGGIATGRLYRSPDAIRRRKQDLNDCDSGPTSKIYHHVVRRGGRIYIDYWWYLRFNNAPGKTYDHQSDWEGGGRRR